MSVMICSKFKYDLTNSQGQCNQSVKKSENADCESDYCICRIK